MLRIALGAVIGAALVFHVVAVAALKLRRVDISVARSIKPGMLENRYRRIPPPRSPVIGVLVTLAGLTKILAVIAAAAFFVLRNLSP